MDRRGDHESVIAGGHYGNRRQRASHWLQPGVNVNCRLPFKVCHQIFDVRLRCLPSAEIITIETAWSTKADHHG